MPPGLKKGNSEVCAKRNHTAHVCNLLCSIESTTKPSKNYHFSPKKVNYGILVA